MQFSNLQQTCSTLHKSLDLSSGFLINPCQNLPKCQAVFRSQIIYSNRIFFAQFRFRPVPLLPISHPTPIGRFEKFFNLTESTKVHSFHARWLLIFSIQLYHTIILFIKWPLKNVILMQHLSNVLLFY